MKEALGNHDFMGDSPVVRHIVRRHGGIAYSFDWDDLHVACLGMYPSADRLRWLEEDLRTVTPGRPVVVFFHYGIDGPWSQSWESQEEREELARVLAGHRVAAIFHGHAHRAGSYRWREYDVFRPGSPKHSSREVIAVRDPRRRGRGRVPGLRPVRVDDDPGRRRSRPGGGGAAR